MEQTAAYTETLSRSNCMHLSYTQVIVKWPE
jgi:hypothetical protein